MDNSETDWNQIFSDAISCDIEILDTIPFELLVKYQIVVGMQFYIFEQMFEGKIDVGDVQYMFTDKKFDCNENDLLKIADTVKFLSPKRDKIISIIQNNPISDTDYDKMYRSAYTEYAKSQGMDIDF